MSQHCHISLTGSTPVVGQIPHKMWLTSGHPSPGGNQRRPRGLATGESDAAVFPCELPTAAFGLTSRLIALPCAWVEVL
ncbi:hypothetical protein [Stenomitos frigidus]|uniref:hypothetical protein n=1 Tax=Stenomitos frigidus TaxID=1886765 RepID=UPI0011B262DF|nr:hypothetical protein [Stenomitos frigidus]